MESWLQRLVLATLFATSLPALGQQKQSATALDDIIDSGLERRRIQEARLDTENFEFGVFGGVMSVEDFGSNDVFGARLAYHITEDFFLEGAYGQTETGKTSYETLSGSTQLLTDDQRQLRYYNVGLGFNMLPGEVYLGKLAFNTSYYLIGGVGNTLFADDEYLTYSFGAGFRFAATDWLALRVDFRNHIFSHSLLGERKSIQNLEANLGATLYF
jgi:outer membrane beta-barrel protein